MVTRGQRRRPISSTRVLPDLQTYDIEIVIATDIEIVIATDK
jgi:hypothetical protein